MKRKLILIAVAGISTFIFAQSRPQKSACDRFEKQKNWMKDSLNLSATQKSRVDLLFANKCKKLDSIQHLNLEKEQKATALKSVRKESAASLNQILTPQQREKWKAHVKTVGKNHPNHKGQNGNKKPHDHYLKDSLNLTDVQKKKLEELKQKNQAEMKMVQEKYANQPDSLKKYSLLQRKQAAAEAKAVLTPEQQKKLKEHRKATANKQNPEMHAQKATEKLDKIVTLTADQKAKVQELNKKFSADVTDLKNKYSDKESTEFKEAMKNLRKGHQAEIQKILTDDQKRKLKEARHAK